MFAIITKEEKALLDSIRVGSVEAIEGLDKISPLLLTEQIIKLKNQIVELGIEKSKKEEDFAKQDRELRHMIGLEKNRQAVELEQAKKAVALESREERLKVQEANLAEERKAFKEMLEFNTKRYEQTETYLKQMFGEVMNRLPNITVKGKLK